MEGTGDVNATVDNAVQDLHIRSKESDQSLRLDSCNVVGAPAVLLSRENEWMEPHSLRSPEHFSETLEDQVLLRPRSFDIGSGQPSSSPLILNSSDIMVEELTMNNYKSSNLTVGCSNKKEESPMSKGQWRHLYLLSGGCRIGSSPMDTVSKEPVMLDGRDEDARNMFSPNYLFQNLQSSKHVVEGHHGISERLTNSTLTNFPGERRTKVLPRSGFSEFFVRNTLKGKGAAHGDLQIHGESEIVNLNNVSEKMICDGVAPNTWQGSGAKADHLSINIGASAGAASGHDRINLREWLKPGCHKINKVESLQIFKQILELVDFAHSQGVVLKDLKPSYFMIVSSDKVQYVGSWVTQIYSKLSENVINQEDHYSTHHLKRKGSMEDGMNRNSVLARRHQKLSENVELVGQQPRSAARFGLKIGTMMKGDIMSLRENASGYCLREEQILNKGNRTPNVSGCPSEYTKHMQLTSEGVNLEERWYTSPEDLSYRMCTLESNIYCLGVLMFEV